MTKHVQKANGKLAFPKSFHLVILAVTCGITLYLQGCEKNTEVFQEPVKTESQEIRAYLVSEYGFSNENIQETDKTFIVEGDIVFPKRNFWENYKLEDNKTEGHDSIANYKHYKSLYKVSPTPRTILVGIDPGVPSTWNTAITNAISSWNGLCGKILFSSCNCCPVNGIYVTYGVTGTSTTMASSGFPTSNGNPYNSIIINSQFSPSMTPAEKKKTAAHELGHCIGMMHTDVVNSSAYLITTANSSCNTNTDPSSIMNQGKFAFTGFSTCDVAAYWKVYP